VYLLQLSSQSAHSVSHGECLESGLIATTDYTDCLPTGS